MARSTAAKKANGGTPPLSWVAFLDAYGFSSEVRLRNEESVAALFMEIGQLVQSFRQPLDTAFQFSDSVFLVKQVQPDPVAALSAMIEAIAKLQKCALTHRLAFRGVVCAGPVTVTEFGCFGTPIEEAVRMETRLASPVVIIPSRQLINVETEIRRDKRNADDFQFHLKTQTVHTKTGELDAHVIEPPLRAFADLAHIQLRRSQLDGPDHVPQAWRLALNYLNIQSSH